MENGDCINKESINGAQKVKIGVGGQAGAGDWDKMPGGF
jgi:hypothetical protein